MKTMNKDTENANITNFTLNGIGYAQNEKTGYCFRYVETIDENGKKFRQSIRIGKNEFHKALQDHEDEVDAKMRGVIERMVEEQDNEEVARIQKEMTKTPKAHSKKKVQTGGMEFTEDGVNVVLTAKQVDFIKHLPDTCFWENGLDSCIWIDCLCDEIGGQFENKPMTVGAMISTLCEKGLGSRGSEKRNGRKCTSFGLTELGKKVAAGLGL